jgi:hypothetical protein
MPSYSLSGSTHGQRMVNHINNSESAFCTHLRISQVAAITGIIASVSKSYGSAKKDMCSMRRAYAPDHRFVNQYRCSRHTDKIGVAQSTTRTCQCSIYSTKSSLREISLNETWPPSASKSAGLRIFVNSPDKSIRLVVDPPWGLSKMTESR